MTATRVLCVGAAHWDLIARSVAPLEVGGDVPGEIVQRPGGVALNVAIGLAARGLHVRLCSVVGEDEAGRSLTEHAEAKGVDCGHVLQIRDSTTGRYMAIENAAGEMFAAVADVGALERHASEVVREASRALDGADILFLDTNLPEPEIEAIAKEAAARSVEIVVNPVSTAKARRLASLLSAPYAPTVVANLGEANALLGSAETDTANVALALVGAGVGAALVTDGDRPAALATREGVVTSTPPALTGAASVTGAGDALLAGYLAFPGRQSDPKAALDAALQAAQEHMMGVS